MRVLAEICVVPLGVGLSVSEYVAACVRVLDDAGLNPQTHAYGTNVEGEWDEVFAAFRRCHEAVHALGAPRIHTSIKVGTRNDREQTLKDKVDSVQHRLAGSVADSRSHGGKAAGDISLPDTP